MTEGITKRHQQTFGVTKGSLSGFGDGFTSVCIKQNLLFSLNVYIVLHISYTSKTYYKFKKNMKTKLHKTSFLEKKVIVVYSENNLIIN